MLRKHKLVTEASAYSNITLTKGNKKYVKSCNDITHPLSKLTNKHKALTNRMAVQYISFPGRMKFKSHFIILPFLDEDPTSRSLKKMKCGIQISRNSSKT